MSEMPSAQPRLEQLSALWVDGKTVAYKAAALARATREGMPPWHLIVADPDPWIERGPCGVELVLEDDQMAYKATAQRTLEAHTTVNSVVLVGDEPLTPIEGWQSHDIRER
jgi:hypothetical protein